MSAQRPGTSGELPSCGHRSVLPADQLGIRFLGDCVLGSTHAGTWRGTWLRSPALAANDTEPTTGSVKELVPRSTSYCDEVPSIVTSHCGDAPKITRPS